MNFIAPAQRPQKQNIRLGSFSEDFANDADDDHATYQFSSDQEVWDKHDARQLLQAADTLIKRQQEHIRQLEALALTDELTGLMNRRGLMMALKREIAACRRDKKASGMLIMIDLDGFKQINDTWGHAVGDLYLRTVASVLTNEIRSSDLVMRLGGDEFAVLMPRITATPAAERLKKLFTSFTSKVMYWQGQTLPLCASFGGALYTAADTPETVMQVADLKLYAHKARLGVRQRSVEEEVDA